MAIAGMGMYQSTSSFFGMFTNGGFKDPFDNGKNFGHTLTQHSGKSEDAMTEEAEL